MTARPGATTPDRSGVVIDARGPSVWTGSRLLHLLDPSPDEIDLCDIARTLAKVCRFGGACDPFYSVAQHSLACLEIALQMPDQSFGRDALLWVLMHDAAEAYCGDITRPLKAELPAYQAIESRLMAAICSRFGMDPTPPPVVKICDNIALATEKRDLCQGSAEWPGMPAPHWRPILDLSGPAAEADGRFLLMAWHLGAN